MQKITDDIVYIGAHDKDLDLFESQYQVPEGISYNSYLIKDDKNVVMDTIDARKEEEWLENLQTALEGQPVDYLVISHMEPDHSASIAKLAELYPDMKLVGNAKTFNMLTRFFDIDNLDARKVVVNEGDTLDTGHHTLHFYMAPMVHWPEVMVAYDDADKVLFSADAFGRFGSTNPADAWDEEARRYYTNIVGKYGPFVQKALKKLGALDIEVIAPLHGPVLKENLPHVLELYNAWSSYTPESKGVLIAYASIHGNTAKAARKLAAILEEKGVEVSCMDLSRVDKAQAVAKAFQYPVIVLMASSYDSGVFPAMESFINALLAKGLKNRAVFLAENSSWAPSAARTMKKMLEPAKTLEIQEPVFGISSVLKEKDIPSLEAFADTIKAAL